MYQKISLGDQSQSLTSFDRQREEGGGWVTQAQCKYMYMNRVDYMYSKKTVTKLN